MNANSQNSKPQPLYTKDDRLYRLDRYNLKDTTDCPPGRAEVYYLPLEALIPGTPLGWLELS